MKPHEEGKLEVLIKKDVDKTSRCHQEEKTPPGDSSPSVRELGCCDFRQQKFGATSANATNRLHENHPASSAPDDDDRKDDEHVEDGEKKPPGNRSSYSNSKEQVRHGAAAETEDKKAPGDQLSRLLNSVKGFITSKQKSKESVHGQIKQETANEAEEVAANRSYGLGYFAGKLSDVYKNAGKKLQDTQDVIQNVAVGEIKVVLLHYVTMMSRELPLIRPKQPEPEPEPAAENRVHVVDLSKDGVLQPSQSSSTFVFPGVSGWPEGSVSSLRNTSPEVFHQRLVQLPPALSQLQPLSPQEMLEKLELLAPQMTVSKLLSIFWLQTADRQQPTPKPGCLLLSERDVIVLSSKNNSNNTLTISHHFNLLEIKKVQISLAGQHVRLTGCSEETVLAVFTHSKELSQEFCRALLKALCPQRFSEGTEDHVLLSGDLMALSLDWTSRVPDIVLDGGLHVTSRFKRVLADLLYIVHGNMDGPDKPSLAHVCPLLYTSVKVLNSARVRQSDIFQFLLTDTHLALLREDGVFHPAPRGSSLVPAQPQFRGLELRRRSEIRCLLVRQSDSWLVVDVTFNPHKPQTGEKKAEPRRASISHSSGQGDSWKLSFGCTSEAAVLIHHLTT